MSDDVKTAEIIKSMSDTSTQQVITELKAWCDLSTFNLNLGKWAVLLTTSMMTISSNVYQNTSILASLLTAIVHDDIAAGISSLSFPHNEYMKIEDRGIKLALISPVVTICRQANLVPEPLISSRAVQRKMHSMRMICRIYCQTC